MDEINYQPADWQQSKEFSGRRQFLYLILLTIGGLVLTIIISAFAIIPYALTHGKAALSDMNNLPKSLMNVLIIIQDICLFGVSALVFSKIVSKRKDYFYFGKHSTIALWLFTIVIAFATMPVSDLLGTINEKIPLPHKVAAYFHNLEDNYDSQISQFLNFKTPKDFVMALVIIGLLPAVFEELFFRGALQQVMLKWIGKAFPAILITSVLFSASHMSYYGFLPRALLGMVLGYVYYYGKNIWLNMLIHFVNNATVVIALYVEYGNKSLTKAALNDSSTTPWYIQLIGVVVLIAALSLFIRKSETQIENHTF